MLNSLIQSECQLVDNNLLHADRLAAYEAASNLLSNIQDTQNDQIVKRIKKKYPGKSGSKGKKGSREPRNSEIKRNRRQILEELNIDDQEEQMISLMEKANFDEKTFLFGLGIIQNRVTDIKNATVRELQALRDGLTLDAVKANKQHSHQNLPKLTKSKFTIVSFYIMSPNSKIFLVV